MTVSFQAKYGPWALITGASRGMGAEFARQCAERGLNTVLVATNAELLQARADSIIKEYGVAVRTIVLDLSREDFMRAIIPVTDSLEIGLLINNAGLSKVSPFLNLSRRRAGKTAARQRAGRPHSGPSLRPEDGRT